jgi:hypothetical protein
MGAARRPGRSSHIPEVWSSLIRSGPGEPASQRRSARPQSEAKSDEKQSDDGDRKDRQGGLPRVGELGENARRRRAGRRANGGWGRRWRQDCRRGGRRRVGGGTAPATNRVSKSCTQSIGMIPLGHEQVEVVSGEYAGPGVDGSGEQVLPGIIGKVITRGRGDHRLTGRITRLRRIGVERVDRLTGGLDSTIPSMLPLRGEEDKLAVPASARPSPCSLSLRWTFQLASWYSLETTSASPSTSEYRLTSPSTSRRPSRSPSTFELACPWTSP